MLKKDTNKDWWILTENKLNRQKVRCLNNTLQHAIGRPLAHVLLVRPLPFNSLSIIQSTALATCPWSVLNLDWFTPLFEYYYIKSWIGINYLCCASYHVNSPPGLLWWLLYKYYNLVLTETGVRWECPSIAHCIDFKV